MMNALQRAKQIQDEMVDKEDWEMDLSVVPDHCDPRPGQELKVLLVNDVLEDKASLDGATTAQARDYFNRWRQSLGENDGSLRDNTRYQACIVLDAVTREQLDTAPDINQITAMDPTTNTSHSHWVKLVSSESCPSHYTDDWRARNNLDPDYPEFGEFRVRLFSDMDLWEYCSDRFEHGEHLIEGHVVRENTTGPLIRYWGR